MVGRSVRVGETGMIRRLLLAGVACVTLAASAWPNGCYIPEAAYPDRPKIPLQRAVIVHRDGIETLIVESAFESASPSVAWILPLPTEPTKLAVADSGICKSLSMCLRPQILHDLHHWWTPFAWVVGLLAPVVLVLVFVKDHRRRNALLVGLAIIYVLIGFLVPGLGHAGLSVGAGSAVDVKTFERVGNYDVAVLRAKEAAALSDWLKERLLQPLDAPAVKLVDDYITRGWCFVVARLRREAGGAANPHPISATFPAERPVYPMKLTSLAGSTTRVELFIIAEQTAGAERFRRVASDMFGPRAAAGSDDVTRAPHYAALETGLVIGSPDVGELMWGGCVVTHLAAELTPRQMGFDVGIGLSEMKPHRDVVFSKRGRRELVRTVLLCGAVVVLLVSAALFRGRRIYRWWKHKVLLVLVALVLLTAGVVRVAVSVVPVRAGRELGPIGMYIRHQQLTSTVLSLAREGRMHAGMTTADLSTFPDLLDNVTTRPGSAVNPFTGEKMRFERSPGNFSTRTVDNVTYFCLYDADCREYRVALPPAPAPKTESDVRGQIIVTHTPEFQIRGPLGPQYDDEKLPEFPHPTAEDKAVAKGLVLLKEEKLDEARAAYGRNCWEFERDLRALGREAAGKGQVRRALAFYVKLLGSRQCLLWDQVEINEWPDVDAEYLALVEKAPANERDEAATQDLAARDLFGRLKKLLDARDFKSPQARRELYRIADAYLSKYPKARLALTALLGASCAAQNEEPAAGIRRIDELLAKMRTAGRSRYDLDTVLSTFVTWTVEREEGDRELTVRAREACEEIAREGEERSRAEWLVSAADYSLQAREEDGRRARRLYTEVLALNGEPAWARQARAGIVRTHTEIEGPNAGLAALRDLEGQSGPDADFSLALWTLADAYRDAEKPGRAIALLEEMIRPQPTSVRAAYALRKIADIQKDAGDDRKMLAALQSAASCLPPDMPLDIQDGCQRSFIYEDLADYHVEKRNWAEALKWSKAWKVQTGCGNCDDTDRSRRRKYIALAFAGLGDVDACLKAAERLSSYQVPDVAETLVDVFRGKGELDALVAKLRGIPAGSKQEGAAKIALEYVGILELVDRKDLPGLWRKMDFGGKLTGEDWPRERASTLIATMGPPAKPFLIGKLDSEGPEYYYALFALSRMKAPEVLPLIRNKLPTLADEYDLRRCFRALALLHTDEAYDLLEYYAEHGTAPQKEMAKLVLETHPKSPSTGSKRP